MIVGIPPLGAPILRRASRFVSARRVFDLAPAFDRSCLIPSPANRQDLPVYRCARKLWIPPIDSGPSRHLVLQLWNCGRPVIRFTDLHAAKCSL